MNILNYKWRIIEYSILLSILVIQIYLLVVALPYDKKIYEDCNMKVLCENNAVDFPICKQYKNIQNNTIPNIIVK